MGYVSRLSVLFLYSPCVSDLDVLTSGALLTLEALFLLGLTNSWRWETLAWEQGFHMQTKQSRAHHPTSFIGVSGPLILCHNLPRTRYQSTRGNSHTPKPAKVKSVYPALPIPSHQNHSKDSCSHFFFSHSLCLLIDLGASLCDPAWHGMSLPLGKCKAQSIFSTPVFF